MIIQPLVFFITPYMSKIIVEEHCKGKLSVTNGEYGAKFTITIPLSPEPNRNKAVEESDF